MCDLGHSPSLGRCLLCPHFFTLCHSNPSPAPSHVPSLFVFIKVLSVAFLSSHTAQPAAPNLHFSLSHHLKAISSMLWKSRTKTDPYCAQVSKLSAHLIRILFIKLFTCFTFPRELSHSINIKSGISLMNNV